MSKNGRTLHLPTSMNFFVNVGILQYPNAMLEAELIHKANSIWNALEIFLPCIYEFPWLRTNMDVYRLTSFVSSYHYADPINLF